MFTHVAARMARWSPKEAFSRSASVHSLPPEPPLVLLAGARVSQVGISPTDQSCLSKAHTTTLSRMPSARLPSAKKNWLFTGSERAGRRAAAIQSLSATAKLNALDPARWLAGILERLPTCPNSQIDSLLPFPYSSQR